MEALDGDGELAQRRMIERFRTGAEGAHAQERPPALAGLGQPGMGELLRLAFGRAQCGRQRRQGEPRVDVTAQSIARLRTPLDSLPLSAGALSRLALAVTPFWSSLVSGALFGASSPLGSTSAPAGSRLSGAFGSDVSEAGAASSFVSF